MHLGDKGAVQSEELHLQSTTVLPLWLLQILGLAAAAAPTASGALPLAPAASAAITAAAPIGEEVAKAKHGGKVSKF